MYKTKNSWFFKIYLLVGVFILLSISIISVFKIKTVITDDNIRELYAYDETLKVLRKFEETYKEELKDWRNFGNTYEGTSQEWKDFVKAYKDEDATITAIYVYYDTNYAFGNSGYSYGKTNYFKIEFICNNIKFEFMYKGLSLIHDPPLFLNSKEKIKYDGHLLDVLYKDLGV